MSKNEITNLLYFVDTAAAGWDVAGEPPENSLYEELKAASEGDFEPLKKAIEALEQEKGK